MSRPVIIAGLRTRFCRLDGAHAHADADVLGARVVEALARGLPAGVRLDDVLLANATGPGGNIARRAVLHAGLDPTTPGITIDRQCSGGLDAVLMACHRVGSGAGELYIAGGTESATNSPLRSEPSPDRFFPRRRFTAGSWDDPGMADSAEIVAAEHGITRTAQDDYAAESHRLAVEADRAGTLSGEIIPTSGDESDDCLRPTLTREMIGRMAPVTTPTGTVTAGNASQIADGAAAVLVASERMARRLGATFGLVHRGDAAVGVDPRHCVLGACRAIEALTDRDLAPAPDQVDQIAMVEAFAAQTCATIDALDLARDRVNPSGGAIAFGHPWGASGAAQVVRLAQSLTVGQDGIAAVAVAGGMGVASYMTCEAL